MDRLRNQDLARLGERNNPRTDMDCEAGAFVIQDIAIPGVQCDPKREPNRPDRLPDSDGGQERVGNATHAAEDNKEPIARRIHLLAPEQGQLRPDESVVPLEQGYPVGIADARGKARGADNVGEQRRRACVHSVRYRSDRPHAPTFPGIVCLAWGIAPASEIRLEESMR
jgi:hypothetical protein